MINLFKAYLFRGRKSVSTIVYIVLLAFFSICPQILSYFMVKALTGGDMSGYEKVNIFEEFLGTFSMISLFALIFTAVFFANDEKNGFIKNIASIEKRKYEIFISRALYLLVYLAVSVVFSLVLFSVSYAIFFHGTAYFKITSSLFGKLLTDMLLSYAILVMISMLTVVTRGTAIPLTVGILYSLNFFALFTSMADWLIRKITGVSFDSACLLLTSYFDNSYGTLAGRLLVPAAYIIISGAVSVFVLERRDIR